MNAKSKRIVSQIALNAVIVLLLFLMIYPLAFAVWNAFKSGDGYRYTRWYPTLPLHIANIGTAWSVTYRWMFNTVFVGVLGTAGMLFLSSMASFAFAKLRFPGKSIFFSMVIVLMMIPSVLTLIPSYLQYKAFGMYDSHLALILPIWTAGCIFSVFLTTSFFSGLPKDIFEATQIDGGTKWHCYLHIAVPLSVPILSTIAIMQLINTWNDYLWPSLLLPTEEKLTISAGLILFCRGEYSSNYPLQFAGYLVASTPLIVLFIGCNKFYIQGLVSSGIKM